MRTVKAIKDEMREIRREMKAMAIKSKHALAEKMAEALKIVRQFLDPYERLDRNNLEEIELLLKEWDSTS